MAKLTEAPNNFRGVRFSEFLDIESHAICKVWLTPTLEPISPTRAPVRPRIPLTSPDFDYTPSRATNVAATWRRFGWIPPRAKETHE